MIIPYLENTWWLRIIQYWSSIQYARYGATFWDYTMNKQPQIPTLEEFMVKEIAMPMTES